MSQQELLIAVVRCLDTAKVDYMMTGSLASSLFGEPRATHDFDVVVAFREDRLAELHALLAQLDGYVDPESMRRAIKNGTMFNFIDHATGLKVDFWILGREPYEESCFARRRAPRFRSPTAGARRRLHRPLGRCARPNFRVGASPARGTAALRRRAGSGRAERRT